jgi:NAD(P)-dependent dehydrogenase (short-subunit alcohol dehydrogenase family)
VEAEIGGTSVVSVTKAALRSRTRTLASELLPRGIRVNAVSPGVIGAPLFGKLGASEEKVAEIGKGLLAQIPQERFGAAEKIAKAVLFLASTDASCITGAELALQGQVQLNYGEVKVPRRNGRELLAPWHVQRAKNLWFREFPVQFPWQN